MFSSFSIFYNLVFTTLLFSAFVTIFSVFLLIFSCVICNREKIVSKSHKELRVLLVLYKENLCVCVFLPQYLAVLSSSSQSNRHKSETLHCCIYFSPKQDTSLVFLNKCQINVVPKGMI